MKPLNVELDKIVPGNNDRQVFDEEKLRRLAASMKEQGLIYPIIVRPIADGFEIVAGERRYRAAKLLGWDEVSCVVRNLNDEDARSIMLLENSSREDLNPIEEANAYEVRMREMDWTATRVANVAGVSVDTVKARVKLLNLADEVQRLVASGQIPMGHASLMVNLDLNRQVLAVRLLNSGRGVTKREFGRYVSDLRAEQDQEAMFDLTQFWVERVEEDDLHLCGKGAIVNVKSRKDLPAPDFDRKDSAGEFVYRYIKKLEAEGYEDEAMTIARMYEYGVRWHKLMVPREVENN